MWGRDGGSWAGAYAPGANEAALRAQAALALGVGAEGLPQVCLGMNGMVKGLSLSLYQAD